MATNRVTSSGDHDRVRRGEAAASDYSYTVSSNGSIMQEGTIDCEVGESFQFTGANFPVEAIRDGQDQCQELFGVQEIVVGQGLYYVQQTAKGNQYCITTNQTWCAKAKSAANPQVANGDENGGGTVGTIKVGST